jgi:hypothetical protein
MRLYWDSHALFLLGTSPSATRLPEESASQGHRLLTSSWAVATARENLKRRGGIAREAWLLAGDEEARRLGASRYCGFYSKN